MRQEFVYTRDYPAKRGHFDPTLANLKVNTLNKWLASAKINLRSRKVCEIGFGGGFCLSFLASLGSQVFGVEAISDNLTHAVEIGLPADSLYLFDELPASIGSEIDLWLFLDSFEHLSDPRTFLEWMGSNSTKDAEVLLVAPNAASVSCRIMMGMWPHRLPDHKFHWSKHGLVDVFADSGFALRCEFRPNKLVSPGMALAHLSHKFGWTVFGQQADARFPNIALPFNIGEMGLVFKRALKQ